MSIRIFTSTGGGVRIGASFGAELEGERQGKFDPTRFDFYVGTSSGSLDAAMSANGWKAEQKIAFFLDNDFAAYFTPPILPYTWRKALAVIAPVKLDKLARLINNLNFQAVPTLIINTVDSEINKQIVYCETRPSWWQDIPGTTLVENAFSTLGYGTILTRSMALPGLRADHPKYKDGGFAENPPLTVLPYDADITMLNLGYSGDAQWQGGNLFPLMAIEDLMYLIEYKNYYYVRHMLAHFPNLKVIYPNIFDVDSTAFNKTRQDKQRIVDRAGENTKVQWQAL